MVKRHVSKSLGNEADRNLRRIRKRSSKSASVPRSTKSAVIRSSSQNKRLSKPTLKDQQLHWMVFQEGGLPDGTLLTYLSHGEKRLTGYKLGRGIMCDCCKTKVSASQFEAHAGWASRKKPYGNIYIAEGVSLHDYAMTLKIMCERPSKYNDDMCRVCGDGGNLIPCDGCPRSFHQECTSEKSIPEGKWYCKYCEKSMKFDGQTPNAIAAGRGSGIDHIEQKTKRCLRIVKDLDNRNVIACVLCRSCDYSTGDFDMQTVIVCDQCEKEYHIGCLREHGIADLKGLPGGNWLCSMDCGNIHSILKKVISWGPVKIPASLMASTRENIANFDVKWVLLSGKDASHEATSLLTEVVNIFHECFDPIIDPTTGEDFITSMLYGQRISDQDLSGMQCAILTVNSRVVTAGIIRVLGRDIAELPLVATSKRNQGKGYFHLLLACIERLLSSLQIKKIVVPAADDVKPLWTNKFGFEIPSPNQLCYYREIHTAMVAFQGTSILEKKVPQNYTI